jgi:hypothetical protein
MTILKITHHITRPKSKLDRYRATVNDKTCVALNLLEREVELGLYVLGMKVGTHSDAPFTPVFAF